MLIRTERLKIRLHGARPQVDWFFGFKRHLLINHHAEIVAFKVPLGNIDDRKPVPEMVQGLRGKAFADRGYISKKRTQTLMERGLQLFTKVKKNMKSKFISTVDKVLLQKRAIIESVNNILKNSCQIEHHPHRSRWNFLSNLMARLACYCLNPNKPKLFFSKKEIQKLGVLEYSRPDLMLN